MTKSPPAGPNILGINVGAAFPIVTVTAANGVAIRTPMLGVPLVGTVVAAGLVLAMSGSGGGSRLRLTLAGIAVSAVLASLAQVVLAANRFTSNEFRYWVSGPLESVDIDSVAVAEAVIVRDDAVVVLISSAPGVLATGKSAAASLGVRMRLIRSLGVVAVTVLAGGATVLGEPLTFVGLVIPLLVRRVVGARQGVIALQSLIVGVTQVCAAGVVSRPALAPSGVPTDITVALIGAPFFIIGSRGKGMS